MTKKQNHRLLSVIGLCAMAMCVSCGGDDTSGSNKNDDKSGAELGASCSSDTKCKSGLDCVDNVCIQYVGKSDNCDDTHLCKSPLMCSNHVCNESSADKDHFEIGFSVKMQSQKTFEKTTTIAYRVLTSDCVTSSANSNPGMFLGSWTKSISKDPMAAYPELLSQSVVFAKDTDKAILFAATVPNTNPNKKDGDPADIIVGYRCVDVSQDMNGQSKDVDLSVMTFDIRGKYTIVSNFDFSSGFTKSNDYPSVFVENMVAGDWVQFMLDLFEDPSKSLFKFVWANSVKRLHNIDSIKNYVEIIDKLLAPGIEEKVSGYLKEKIEAQPWAATLVQVLPDVSDMVKNMQLYGEMNINTEAAGSSVLVGSTEKFTHLLYSWTPCKTNLTASCIGEDATRYVAPGTYRMAMPLGANAIESSSPWNGQLDDSAAASSDALMSINTHSLNFNWALILYNAVFGTILPQVMGYKENIKKFTIDDHEEGRLMTAFLEVIAFKPIINYYNEHKAEHEDWKGSLRTDVGITACQNFIEAAAYMAVGDNGMLLTMVPGLADLACGDEILGKLDELAYRSVAGIKASSADLASLKADNCPVYSEYNNEITQLGKPDEKLPSANDVFSKSVETKRCQWTMTMGTSEIKGLFHSVKKDPLPATQE